MYCRECGTENRNDRKFCSNCGTPLKDYTKPAENLILPNEIEAKQESVKKKNKSTRILKMLIIAFFVIAVILSFTSFLFKGNIALTIIILAIVFYIVSLCLIISCLIIKKHTAKTLNSNKK